MKTIYKILFSLFLLIFIILVINSLKDIFEESDKLFINLFLLCSIGFAIAIIIFQILKTEDWLKIFFHLIILLITIFCLYSFGLDDNKLDVPELTVILVLFFLSELAVGLTNQINELTIQISEVKEDTELIQKETKSMLIQLEESKFRETVIGLPLSTTAANTFKIIFAKDTAAAIIEDMEKYFISWQDIFKKIGDQDEGIEKVQIMQWLFNVYVEEENNDLTKRKTEIKVAKKGIMELGKTELISFDTPRIATNENFYLMLLQILADKMVNKYGDENKICFHAITVVTPEYWYNWKHNKGKKYVLDAIDSYRNTVKRIIYRHGDKIEYQRLVLLDQEDFYEEKGIENCDKCLNEQKERVIITINPSDKLKEEDTPYKDLYNLNKIITKQDLKIPELESIILESGQEERKYAYFIINKSDLPKLNFEITKFHNTDRDYSNENINVNLMAQSMILKFIEELHSNKDNAFYALLHDQDLEDHLCIDDHDLLMIGIKRPNNLKPKWLFSVSTNLRPGYETMLMSIHTENEVLKKIYDFSQQLKAERRLFKWYDLIKDMDFEA